MIVKKIVNEYVFDLCTLKRFYQVNLRSNFFLILLLLVLVSTISSFLKQDFSFGIFSAIVFFLGCIYYFILPYILARMAYRSFLDQAKGKDCKMKITITEEEITVENKTTKSKEVYSTSIVNKIREKRDAICLLTDRNLGVFLSKSGFTHGNRDDLYFIFNKSRSKGRGV